MAPAASDRDRCEVMQQLMLEHLLEPNSEDELGERQACPTCKSVNMVPCSILFSVLWTGFIITDGINRRATGAQVL
jgi:hypothetical protein